MREMLLMFCSAALMGCATPMTVREYVNSRMLRNDPGFQATIEAANYAQAAFNYNADTPIEELQQNPQKLIEMVNRSRDTYRRASSYRIDGRSATLYPALDHVKLIDMNSPDATRVPIQGMDAAFRVSATPEQVTIVAIESSRGLPVVTFDNWMKPTIANEFRPFLVGDRVNVFGDFKLQLQRGNSPPPGPPSHEPLRYYPPAAPNQPIPAN